GAVVSLMITFCVCVLSFPFSSSNVQVITVVPCAVIGKVASFVTVTVPLQLSVAVGGVTSLSRTSHCAVISSKVAASGVGAKLSSTVTVASQVSMTPWLSVTVSVTVFSPMSSQSKSVMLMLSVTVPSSSEEPLSISSAVMLAVPFSSNSTVKSWQTATGGLF